MDDTNDLQAEVQRLTSELQDFRQVCRSPALHDAPDGHLTEKLLAHPATEPFPDVVLGKSPAVDNPERVSVAERLIAAYRKAVADERTAPLRCNDLDLWTTVLRDGLPDLIACVEKGDAAGLAEYLKHFGESFVWFGGITTCIDGYNANTDPRHVALTYHDKLVCLAEYLDLLPYESPENHFWGKNLHSDPNELVAQIEKVLSISINPPAGIIHTDGLETMNGLFHYRHFNGLYAAIRMHQLNESHEPCCEFGGGLGITAMYAGRLGIRDYTLLDLPITCLLAGHYLLHAVGQDSVVLYGEAPKADAIKVLPYWECENLPDKHFALSFNQDSFPEIARKLVETYLREIRRMTKKHFLSVNHEGNYPKTVACRVREAEGYRRLYRFKYWMREGYLEELFEIH